ncbi:MAG: DUF4351 domain-containing protein [Magnetococcales bacterium]|nr:DUF4351 domain-containing protein [Magnetococcales bacterium]
MQYVTSVERIGMRKGERIGRLEGRVEGRVEGRLEGKAEMLLKQLQVRFGSVPDPVRERVSSAEIEELDAWAVKIFQADSLQTVFQ